MTASYHPRPTQPQFFNTLLASSTRLDSAGGPRRILRSRSFAVWNTLIRAASGVFVVGCPIEQYILPTAHGRGEPEEGEEMKGGWLPLARSPVPDYARVCPQPRGDLTPGQSAQPLQPFQSLRKVAWELRYLPQVEPLSYGHETFHPLGEGQSAGGRLRSP